MRSDHHTATDASSSAGSADILAHVERELPDGLPVGELGVATRASVGAPSRQAMNCLRTRLMNPYRVCASFSAKQTTCRGPFC